MEKAYKKITANKDAQRRSSEKETIAERAKIVKSIIKEAFDEYEEDFEDAVTETQGMEQDEDMDIVQALKELENLEGSMGVNEGGHEEESEEHQEEMGDDEGLNDNEIDEWLNEFDGSMKEEDTMDESDDITAQVDKLIQDLKRDSSKGGDAEVEEGYNSLEEEYDETMETADDLEGELEDDIMSELRKVYEMEMEENMSTSLPNRKGMNLKPDAEPWVERYQESVSRNRKLAKENRELKEKMASITENHKKLREASSKLSVFNDNLTNIVSLFVENSLTKNEKNAVIEKFFQKDPATPAESKVLKENIQKSINNRMQKIMEAKNKPVATDAIVAGKKNIVENVAYKDPAMEKMMRLINFKAKN